MNGRQTQRTSIESSASSSLLAIEIALFRRIFANVEQLAAVCTLAGKIIETNENFDHAFPVVVEGDRSIFAWDLPFLDSSEQSHYKMKQAILEAGEGRTAPFGCEVELDGAIPTFVSWSISPVLDDAGVVAWILIQAVDQSNWLSLREEIIEKNLVLENEIEHLKRQSTDLEWNLDTLEGQSSELADIADEVGLAKMELAREIEERKRLEEELRRVAITDPLTGAYNRRHLMEVGSQELARMQNGYKPFSIISFDIDHFKKVNDTWSHQAGDDVLVAFTTTCKSVLGGYADRFFRVGGEEFICLLQETDTEMAAETAEALRCAIQGLQVSTCGTTLSITASLGVAECKLGESLSNVMNRADDALYQAKDMGRNKVVEA